MGAAMSFGFSAISSDQGPADISVPDNIPAYLTALQVEVRNLESMLRSQLNSFGPQPQNCDALIALLKQRSSRLNLLMRNYANVRMRQLKREIASAVAYNAQQSGMASTGGGGGLGAEPIPVPPAFPVEVLRKEYQFLDLMFPHDFVSYQV